MKKHIISGLIFLVSVSACVAQNAKVVSAFNYLKEGDFAQAKSTINEAIQDPKTGAQAKTWFYRGAIYEALYGDTAFRKKNPDALTEAIRSYQKAMELDPKNQWKDQIQQGLIDCAGYSYNEGVAPYNTKDYQTAYNNFRQAADVYQYLNTSFGLSLIDTFATLYAANAAVKLKHYDDATALYTTLQNKNISRPEIYSNLGDLYLSKGDTAKAQEIIGKGTQLFPNDKPLMIQELNVYLFSKDYVKAIDKLKEAIDKDPNFGALYIQLGNMYDLVKDTTNARLAYEQAITKDPSNFDGYYRLGASYYNRAVDFNNQMNKLPVNAPQKQYDALRVQRDALFKKALPFLERSHEIDSRDMDTMLALKELYARLNMLEKLEGIKKEIESVKG